MAHAGVNPHTAADLLRQAVAQNNARHNNEDLTPDHVYSGAPTPSGVQTPRPDFQDKRMPGIMHSYFGQVGSRLLTKSPTTDSPASTAPPSDTSATSSPARYERKKSRTGRRASASSVGSLVEIAASRDINALPTSDSVEFDAADKISAPGSAEQPSTPLSWDPYEIHEGGEAAENGAAMADTGFVSITQALKNFVRPTGSSTSKAQRHQSLPVSGVNKSIVPAAHISNPSSDVQSSQVLSPAHASPQVIAHDSRVSIEELEKLTVGATPVARKKNTPPLTPRALSREDKRGAKSPRSNISAPTSDDGGSAQPSQRMSDPSPTILPRGKLTITIAEGRGLRPAFDPYCVCVFEYNEYISRGPRQDRMDIDSAPQSAAADPTSVPIKRTDSDVGRAVAIPMKSRQSSTNGASDGNGVQKVTDPHWNHEAIFDVVGEQSEIGISVYDKRPGTSQDIFLGHVRTPLGLSEQDPSREQWLRLVPRGTEDAEVTGEILIKLHFAKAEKRHFGPNDFQILKLIGKGTFGQVYQVRKKDTGRIYAMKVLSKKVIIQKKEVAHTLGERNILVRTATTDSPFIVGLKFSFQTPTDLYLVTDFMSGGELFWHLQKEGRFREDRAKFYIAELILALKHLHEHDIVYRDLKPENILLDANGHIALCDFGLSKANLTKNDTTNTFCGTTEYLAPEVLLDEQGYTKMVDFWSLGVLVFEMCCGWSPFYAEDTQQMYKNIAFGKVRFPRDALSSEGRNFVKGLLNRNPKHRLGANSDAQELIEHPFFADVDWVALSKKNLVPPFKPKLSSMADTSNFDPEFTNALNTSSSLNARAAALAGGVDPGATPLSPTMQNAFKGFTFVDESQIEQQFSHRQHDEDEEMTLQRTQTKEELARNRMSGIQRSAASGEEGLFGGEDWDM